MYFALYLLLDAPIRNVQKALRVHLDARLRHELLDQHVPIDLVELALPVRASRQNRL